MRSARDLLPSSVVVLERGWLSSNTIVVRGEAHAAVVDSGYWTHAPQTAELVAAAAGDLPVTTLVNTHLHSDHCGGNAELQGRYPLLRTVIPPGQAQAVRHWDPVALSYTPTGQYCPPFGFDDVLEPGGEIGLGDLRWQVRCAPGHDPHSVILFEPVSRTLMSADALWENGFGVIFEELEGREAFSVVAATLDMIERLAPRVVVPGHGSVFSDVEGALARARSRLSAYLDDPRRHAAHGAKVLLKFKLLELQCARISDFTAWAERAAYFRMVHDRWFPSVSLQEWLSTLMAELVRSGVAKCDTENIANA